MQTMNSFFAEYDRMQQTCTAQELEAWLITQCEAHEQDCPDDKRMSGALYNELASFYKHRGMLEQAEKAFLKSKALWETEEKDANYATIINNLAGTYRLLGNYDEAARLFQESIELYQQYPQTPKELSSSAYNNLALVYMDTGRFQEAAQMLQAAYDEMKDTPECFTEKATTFANMAFAYYKNGDLDLADEKVRIADDFYKNGNLENTPDYQAFLKVKEILQKS